METTLSFVGTRSSGKTTCAGLLYMTAVDQALRNSLKVRVRQKSMDILRITSGLHNGEFPPPNPMGSTFKADIALEFGHWLWSKHRVNIAFVDVAGEEVAAVMKGYAGDTPGVTTPFSSGQEAEMGDVNRNVLNSAGFILIADLAKIMGKEPEAQGIGYTDAALAQYISSLFEYKKRSPTTQPFRGIAAVLTKYDAVENDLARENLALVDKRSFASFMERRMPLTYTALRSETDLHKVEYFFSRLELNLAASPSAQASGPLDSTPAISQPARPRIRVNRDVGRPEYSKDQYELLLRWIRRTFAA